MRLTKIYTKTGDAGSTMLATGTKISKSSLRINSYGTIDELNAVVGMLRDEILKLPNHGKLEVILAGLRKVQNELFDVGGELSIPLEFLKIDKQQIVGKTEYERLELEIDRMNELLPPLENFVLPGGHSANSTAHLARTVCRRAERVIVELSEVEKVRPEVLVYLNRLSDWLFVLCREISKILGISEVIWNQRRK